MTACDPRLVLFPLARRGRSRHGLQHAAPRQLNKSPRARGFSRSPIWLFRPFWRTSRHGSQVTTSSRDQRIAAQCFRAATACFCPSPRASSRPRGRRSASRRLPTIKYYAELRLNDTSRTQTHRSIQIRRQTMTNTRDLEVLPLMSTEDVCRLVQRTDRTIRN